MNSQQTSDKTSEIYVWGDDFPIKSDTREGFPPKPLNFLLVFLIK